MLIQQAVTRLVKNKTVLTIAHNLSAIRTVDQILVLDQGRLAEQGNHTALINQNGPYARLWTMSQQVTTWTADT